MSIKKILSPDRLATPVGQGVIAGLMEVCYIGLVAIFLTATQTLLNDTGGKAWLTVFGIMMFLSLLVLSVAMSGVIVFRWPAEYFMERQYKKSVACFMATAATMFVLFVIIFIGATLLLLIK